MNSKPSKRTLARQAGTLIIAASSGVAGQVRCVWYDNDALALPAAAAGALTLPKYRRSSWLRSPAWPFLVQAEFRPVVCGLPTPPSRLLTSSLSPILLQVR